MGESAKALKSKCTKNNSIESRSFTFEKCTWIDACHMYSLLFRLWPLPLKGLDPRFATQQVKRVCFGDSLRSVFTVAAEPEFIGFAIASGAFGEAALNLLLVFALEPPN